MSILGIVIIVGGLFTMIWLMHNLVKNPPPRRRHSDSANRSDANDAMFLSAAQMQNFHTHHHHSHDHSHSHDCGHSHSDCGSSSSDGGGGGCGGSSD